MKTGSHSSVDVAPSSPTLDSRLATPPKSMISLTEFEAIAGDVRADLSAAFPSLAASLVKAAILPPTTALARISRMSAEQTWTSPLKPGDGWKFGPARWAIRLYTRLWNRFPGMRSALHRWRGRLGPAARRTEHLFKGK